MGTGLQIYLFGAVLAFICSVQILKDERNMIDTSSIVASLFIMLFSWVGVLALWLGQNIKHNKTNLK